MNVVARWPGATHDSAIFANSRVCGDFEAGRYGNACLLGDSGYPLKVYTIINLIIFSHIYLYIKNYNNYTTQYLQILSKH